MLTVTNLRIEIGARLIVDDARFLVGPGDKVGLVGRNGAGKTTLMSVLCGEAASVVNHSGEIRFDGSRSYLRQSRSELFEDDITPVAHILGSRGIPDLADRLEKLRVRLEEDPSERNIARFSQAEEQYRRVGGYEADSDARRVCAGLGLAEAKLDRPMSTLSGGEHRRVELARALFADGDTLLLDEPSNHLDTTAKEWLMSFLRAYRGGLVLVSHDISLLDGAITQVLHVEGGKIYAYKGTYTEYRNARQADVVRRNKLADSQASEVARLKKLADTMRHQTVARAKTAKSLDKRVERLRAGQTERLEEERSLHFTIPPPPQPGKMVLTASGLEKRYGERAIFSDTALELRRDDRLLVLGLNGAGKTTLLKILAGEIDADRGAFRLGTNVSLGYYAQEHEGLRPDAPVIDHVRGGLLKTDQDIRSLLAMFTLRGEAVFQKAGTLSGGEKTKLALAQLVAQKHNLLLLDEPTNNLDPASREAITAALAEWPGTLVIVSHDDEFVRRLRPTHALVMPEGTFDQWSDELLELVTLA